MSVNPVNAQQPNLAVAAFSVLQGQGAALAIDTAATQAALSAHAQQMERTISALMAKNALLEQEKLAAAARETALMARATQAEQTLVFVDKMLQIKHRHSDFGEIPSNTKVLLHPFSQKPELKYEPICGCIDEDDRRVPQTFHNVVGRCPYVKMEPDHQAYTEEMELYAIQQAYEAMLRSAVPIKK